MGYHNHSNDSDFSRSGISVAGSVDKTVRELRKKGEHVIAAAKRALKEGAAIIKADMERRVPVYKLPKGRKRPPKHVVPGLLKRSIQAEELEDGAVYVFTANARNPYDNFLYGQILEFATWRRIRGKKVAAKKKAFMYPALEANIGTVNKMVKNAIDEAIARGH